MESVEVNGDEVQLSGDPSMGIVKYVQEMQIDVLRKYVDDKAIMEMDTGGEDVVMEALMESEGGFENLKELMWENNMLETIQTIVLATDTKFTLEEFEDMSAREFRDLKQKCELALGESGEPATAADFMESLGIGISSRAREMAREVETVEDSETSSQSPLLTE